MPGGLLSITAKHNECSVVIISFVQEILPLIMFMSEIAEILWASTMRR